MTHKHLFDRELSWLSFNHRVLQECLDPGVPLYEKIKFMAIFSSNLDEFFRVRVASIRSLLSLKKDTKLDFDPQELLNQIHDKVKKDQQLLGEILRNTILPGLKKRGIHLINEKELSENQQRFAEKYFDDQILPYTKPIFISKKDPVPFLQNKALYLVIELESKSDEAKLALIEIPVETTGRFIQLPVQNHNKYVILVDDLIRFNAGKMFDGEKIKSICSVKLTRDAEMYIEDEFSGSLLEKIKEGISRRSKGVPSRFLYNENMPAHILKYLKAYLNLSKDDMVPGGRYHNFNDFFGFPSLSGPADHDKPLPALPCRELDENPDYFELISQKDVLLNFPYQSYDYVINFLEQAARDEHVTEIKITLYRIANPSRVLESLILAKENGKAVSVFVELKARFDEESNILGATHLEQAGIKVIYSIPGIKVHSKICLVTRAEDNGLKYYAFMATGNFNEKTAKIYADMGLFTANPLYTEDLNRVFAYLDGRENDPKFKSLLVAPFNMRKEFESLIKHEIKNVKKGKKGEILVKLNSLQDPAMIKSLYKAAQKGVMIRIIVRGVCCLIPNKENLSENIEGISIIDRFLEHSRVYIFYNDGQPKYFSGSADWMTRNLKRRIEVIFPIFDATIKGIIEKIITIQWSDNSKARIIDSIQINKYREKKTGEKISRSQHQIYNLLKKINSK
jgi:polyphosphate kinase